MKKVGISIILIVIAFILFIIATFVDWNNLFNDPDDSFVVEDCSPSSKTFICRPITPTETTGNVLPIVCGCMPQCKFGEELIISSKPEFWPDGSQKGSFGCFKKTVSNSTAKLVGHIIN